MGARSKLNEIHLVGIAVVSACAGIIFQSLELAILFGVLLSSALVAGGGIRLTDDALFSRSAARAAQHGSSNSRRHRRR